ncbi:MAG: lactate dehydrogenase, partial [Alkaliphilus sp.]|nr:lactate dehydrogenase [Alkaliphilus sp.]
MFNFYNYKGKLLFSDIKYQELDEITEKEAANFNGLSYFLNNNPPSQSRRCFCVSHPSLLFLNHEDLGLISISD